MHTTGGPCLRPRLLAAGRGAEWGTESCFAIYRIVCQHPHLELVPWLWQASEQQSDSRVFRKLSHISEVAT